MCEDLGEEIPGLKKYIFTCIYVTVANRAFCYRRNVPYQRCTIR